MKKTKRDILVSVENATNDCSLIVEHTRNVVFRDDSQLFWDAVETLKKQGYQFVELYDEDSIKANLRSQLEKLNNTEFSDYEWSKLLVDIYKGTREEKIDRLQGTGYQLSLRRDDGSDINVLLIDKRLEPNKNSLQVLIPRKKKNNPKEFDLTILVNGFPLVHIEVRRNKSILKEAFNCIAAYHTDSQWYYCASSLFEYAQIFVISNAEETKYYSSTNRFKFEKASSANDGPKFEFTSFWADEENNKIDDLIEFIKTFLSQMRILRILIDYSLLDVKKELLILRPYQIYAIERILGKIKVAINGDLRDVDAGGYIWHATGSGKTLTSFKAAKLIAGEKIPEIDKVLFVVDRKDLDNQTVKEYEKFQKNSTYSIKSSGALKRCLEVEDKNKIVVTTIQKLNIFVSKHKNHPIYSERLVFIFDECHRSQSNKMHGNIVDKFKLSHMFGFTGTPILQFKDDEDSDKYLSKVKPTSEIFGDQLHKYNIYHAIKDKNVLRFKVDFCESRKLNLSPISRREYLSDSRIQSIVSYTLSCFHRKTLRNNTTRGGGFNSIFATDSIESAKKYFLEFRKQIEKRKDKLKVAVIYSNCCEDKVDVHPIETEDIDDIAVDNLKLSSRESLAEAIDYYNKTYNTNFSLENFEKYYFDVSDRLKKNELHILIVVNMFLTGFDAPTLNTIWIDKNLKMHNLIQAFSRTNRIHNEIKDYGNVICFRPELEEEMNKALSLYMNQDCDDVASVVLVEPFDVLYDQYVPIVERLKNDFPLDKDIPEEMEKEFIDLYGQFLQMRNSLSCYDEFENNEILSLDEIQDYNSRYNDLADKWRNRSAGFADATVDDCEFKIAFIKQEEIDLAYLLNLIKAFEDAVDEGNYSKANKIKLNTDRYMSGSPTFRDKKKFILDFLDLREQTSEITLNKYMTDQYDKEITNVSTGKNLTRHKTKELLRDWFKKGRIIDTGTSMDEILPKISFKQREEKTKNRFEVMDELNRLFRRFGEFYSAGIVEDIEEDT